MNSVFFRLLTVCLLIFTAKGFSAVEKESSSSTFMLSRLTPLLQKYANSGLQKAMIKTKRISLPDTPYAYNGSIIEYGDHYLLFFRHDHYSPSVSPFKTYIYVTELSSDFTPITRPTNLTGALSHFTEDPRAFYQDDKMYLIFNLRPKRLQGHQKKALRSLPSPMHIDRSLQVARYHPQTKKLSAQIHCQYCNQGPIEKNWIPLAVNKSSLRFIYTLTPFTILDADRDPSNYLTVKKFTRYQKGSVFSYWPSRFGVPRAGTMPVTINNREKLIFFHTLYIDPHTQLYYYVMGALTFEAEPPYRITRISSGPILFNSIYDTPPLHTADPYKRVCYPAGAVLKNENGREVIHVSCGENDCAIKILTFDKQSLINALTPYNPRKSPSKRLPSK